MFHGSFDFRILNCILLVAAWSFSHAASGWGQDGHKLICALAERELTAEAREFVDSITAWGIHLDNETPSFPEACLWPDRAKYGGYQGSYEAHFINVPAHADRIDPARDCAALDCILAGLQRSLVYLSRPASGEREQGRKAAALRFLGHLIGDLHQPLHVSHGEDRGGNSIKVSWFGEHTNLHRIWDSDILIRAGISYPEDVDLLAAMDLDTNGNDISGWMEQTLYLAREKAYKGPDGRTVRSGDVLGQQYFNHARPVAIDQLIKAGARLGALLNHLAAGEADAMIIELSLPESPLTAGSREKSVQAIKPPP